MSTATADEKSQAEETNAPDQRERTLPSYDDINTPVILLVGVISAIVTFLTIAFVQGLCYQWQNSYIREREYDYVNQPVQEIVESQKALLAGSETTISIDEAMKKVVDQYQKPSQSDDSHGKQDAGETEHN